MDDALTRVGWLIALSIFAALTIVRPESILERINEEEKPLPLALLFATC